MAGAAAPSFFCPLTMAMMKDPVQDREGLSLVPIPISRMPSLNLLDRSISRS